MDRITLSFGRHGSKKDIPALRSQLEGHQVFVDDSIMTPENRIRAIKAVNSNMEGVRRKMARGYVLAQLGQEYNDGIIEALVPIPGMRYFIVEEYCPEKLKEINELQASRDSKIDDIFRFAVSSYRVNDALSAAFSYLRDYEAYIRARNAGIKEGFRRMPGEIREIFGMNSMQVFARFGSTHGALADDLRTEGLKVDVVSNEVNFTSEIVQRMTGRDRFVMTEEDGIRALYALLYSGYSGDESKERLVFSQLGREIGFINFLDAVAGTRDAGKRIASAFGAAPGA